MINFLIIVLLHPTHFKYLQSQVFDGKEHLNLFIKATLFLHPIVSFRIILFPTMSFSNLILLVYLSTTPLLF